MDGRDPLPAERGSGSLMGAAFSPDGTALVALLIRAPDTRSTVERHPAELELCISLALPRPTSAET